VRERLKRCRSPTGRQRPLVEQAFLQGECEPTRRVGQ
jgi:hypothetical protein